MSRLRSTPTVKDLQPAGALTPARFVLGIAAIWLLAAAILLKVAWAHIVPLEMWDPDDYLRLQQVRDWLGGQSFFDVSQYRIDPPHGLPMHWSRLVDLPLAGLILLLRPFVGTVLAEQVAVTVVPLITLGGALAAIAIATARLAGNRAGLLAAALGATAPLMLFHLLPLRIDHHGWQTMLGLSAIAACFDPRPLRGGILAGLLTVLWLGISLEAMPMAVALGSVFALRWLVWDDVARFRGFAAALGVGGIVLFALLHDRAAWSLFPCDAMGPSWFGPLVVTPIAAAFVARCTEGRGIAPRLAGLVSAGAIGALLLGLTAPACLAGPFGQLDPVVRTYWYQNVPEGMPLWRQAPGNVLMLVGFAAVGIAATFAAWRRAATPVEARNWLTMLLLLLAAVAVSLLVQRAGGFAQGCALPGVGWLLARILDRIGGWRHSLPRVLASAAAIVALSPVGAMVVGEGGLALIPRDEAPATSGQSCMAPCTSLAPIAALPRSYILTGLDLTPRLLVTTRHSFAGSGHHRDAAAIRRVIDAFMGPPDVARRIMAAHGMTYLLIDPTGNEAEIYAKAAPRGLMADLIKGKAPAWLEPVPLPGSTLKLWRRIDGPGNAS